MIQINFLGKTLPQDGVQPLVGEMREPDREVGLSESLMRAVVGQNRAASVAGSIAIASVTLGNASKLFRLTP
jgi:hypothetical protein